MSVQHALQPTEALARIFADLADQWDAETGFLSDSTKAAAHPMYRALIALGPRVIPFMLRDLQRDQPRHWFIALQEITGESPVPPEHFGKIRLMAADWIDWGRQHGYAP